MKKLLSLIFLLTTLALTACSAPRSESADGQTFSGMEQETNRRLEAVGTSLEELDAFIQNNDHRLPDKLGEHTLNTSYPGIRYVLALQSTGAHMAKQGAAPERFAYLCNQVQFSTTLDSTLEYPLDRMIQAICGRGEGVTTIDPPVSPASQ